MELNLTAIASVVSIILGFFLISNHMTNNLKKTFITGKRMDAKFGEFKEAMDENNELKFADLQIVTELKAKIEIYLEGK